MKKRIISVGVWIGIFMATVIVAYAVTNLFFSKSQTSDFSKKQIFQFDLDTGLSSGDVGPGDSFSVSPVIFNDATEEMYVFIQVDMPETANGMLYSFAADVDWCFLSEDQGTVVYAYANSEMIALQPGESTSSLTEQMTMDEVSNAEYASIDDINITITGYAIGTEDISSNPTESWNQCMEIGNIQ